MEKGKESEKKVKKVYKANTIAIKKFLTLLLCTFLLLLIAGPIRRFFRVRYLNTWVEHDIEKYEINLKLPRAYKEVELKSSSYGNFFSSAFKTDTDVKINEEYVLQKPEVVYSGGNILNGVMMMMQCFYTEPTTRSLEDIAESQHILVNIYYENQYDIGNPTTEYATILDTDAIRTTTTLTNEEEQLLITNILVPMKDKEVTITFIGDKEKMEEAENEIQKIIQSIKSTKNG